MSGAGENSPKFATDEHRPNFNRNARRTGVVNQKRKIAVQASKINNIKGMFRIFLGTNYDIPFIIDGGTALELHKLIDTYSSPDIDANVFVEDNASAERIKDKIIHRLRLFLNNLPKQVFAPFQPVEPETRGGVDMENQLLQENKVLVSYAHAEGRYRQIAISLKYDDTQYHILEINIKIGRLTSSHEAAIFTTDYGYMVLRYYSLADLIKHNLKALKSNIESYKHYQGLYNLTGQDKEITTVYMYKVARNFERALLLIERLRNIPGLSLSRKINTRTATPPERTHPANFLNNMARINSAYMEELAKKPDLMNEITEELLKIYIDNSEILPVQLFLLDEDNRVLFERVFPRVRLTVNRATSNRAATNNSNTRKKSRR